VFFGQVAYWLKQTGINAHYNSISRGVIDSRDVVYFLSVIGVFIYLNKVVLESRKW
jgi:ABC-2 type transport system permease protein